MALECLSTTDHRREPVQLSLHRFTLTSSQMGLWCDTWWTSFRQFRLTDLLELSRRLRVDCSLSSRALYK